MRGIYAHCYSIKRLDLSNFNTSKIEDISFMFFNCISLKDLNISNFVFDSKCNMIQSFGNVSKDIRDKIKEQNQNFKAEVFNQIM